jgi:gliding motility-associated-like protein
MNFEMKNMNTNEKNTKCYMNLQNNHVHSYLLNDNNRSIMNRSLFATSLKNWFVSGAAVLLIILASGLDVLAQNVSLTYTGATTWTVPAGVTSITVKAKGAAGGTGGLDGGGNTPTSPGSLGYVNAVYSVVPGDVIGIYPGFKGGNGSTGTNCCGGAGGSSTYGNYGGGWGGNASFNGSSGGGGGGGAATIVTKNSSVVAIAAGGPGGGGHGNCFNSGYAGATWIAAGTTTYGTNGAYGNTCGSSDGGGGGGGGGGALGGLGGWTHVTSCGGECAGDGGYLGTNGVYGAASITSNTIIGNTNANGDVVIEYTAVAGSASANQTICAGNSPANLTLAGFIGDIQWQFSTDNVNFSNISGATGSTLSSAQMGVLTATRYYRAVVSGVVTSNVVTVTVNPTPVISMSNSLCTTNTLQWMTMNNIAAGSASGVGQNGITVAITQSGSGMLNVNGMYQATQFPAQYNVPTSGATIANQYSGNFQACFSQPVVNPVVAFSSIGNPSTCVPIIVSQPYSVVWNGQGMSYTSSTQMTGCEGKTIIRLDGTVTCVNFNYTQSEYYSTIAFGFENQNCYSPTVCSGNSVTLNASGAANYAWTPSAGLNTASGASVIATPTATTTYTVSDPTDICAAPLSVTVNVNPTPVVTVPANIVEMTGTTIPAQTFTSSVTGTTYAWTNSAASIGLAASGSGSTPSFVATNTTASPVTGTINVTPTAPNTCVGAAQAFTITVDPTPNVNQPANVTNCEGTLTTVDFNGTTANTNYLWTNTNTSIGLAASGSNDLSFTSQNPTNVAQTATVTVTPQAYVTQGYVWGSVNENGSLTLAAPAGKVFTNVAFASYGTPTTPVNGNYTLGACNAATSSSVISGLAIGNSTMSVVANNATFGDPCPTSTKALAVKLGYGVSINGAAKTFTITVNPSATIANSSDTICTGTAFNFATGSADIVPSNTTYAWTVVNNTNIGGETAQSTNTSAVSQTLFNLTSVDQIAVYTVTPTSGTAACVGAPFTYNVTVTPLPTTISAAGPTTFCDGGSVTLIAPVAPIQMSYTYQWNLNGTPISGATAISYIAVASGSYTVTVTNNAGCSATSLPVVVTENPLPTVAAITGTTSVCVGSNTILASATTGGTWSSSNTATASVSSTTGVVTGVSAGTAIITYSVTNVNGCTNTQTATVTINAIPTVASLTGATTLCVGANTTLESATIGGAWSTSNAAVATVSASGVVTGVSAGLATITYTVTNVSGCVNSVSADVTINAIPTPTITASGATTFCSSGTVTLTASASSSYLWSNGAQTQAITVNSSGSYYVTVTNAAGCSATSAATVVTMNALPVVAAITGATNLCVGANTTLESATIGGVWSTSSSAIATVSASGVVTGVASGQATITYTVTNGSGCVSSVSADINVNAIPTPSITASGATTFCAGGSVTLTASTGSSYLWSNGAQTQTITVSTSGSYYVTVTNASGCTATSAATSVTVNALPTANILAGGPLTYCQGGSVTLNASPVVSGSTYLWSTGATTSSINVTTSSTITVSITTAAGCSTSSLPTSVFVNANPAATITASSATTFCQGGSVTLTANAGTGLSYQWSNGSNNQTLTVNTSGSNTVTVTDANGCSTTSVATVVTVNSLPVAPVITGTAAVCVGSTTLLSTTASNPVWSSANSAVATVAANGLVTGVSAGTVAITYTTTNANGCVNSQSITVSVNILPTAAISTLGATTFCQGGSVNLLASSAPAGLTYTYQWRLNGTAITGATASTYVATASGAYSVTITTNSGCSATSAATNVTVNPLPVLAANAGATSVCDGNTAVITNAQAGGLWSTANNTVAAINATTGTVTGVNPGTTTITYTYTNANGCTNTASTNFTVNSLPAAVVTANGPTTFCQGGSVVLTASSGSSYLWSTGATTQSITVNTTQDISVTVTNANGCASTSALTAVVVNSLPLANITSLNGNSFCQGGSVTLVASAGSAYSWSNGAITQSITLSASANVTVTVTNANGCSATSAPFAVTMNAAPIATVTASGATTFCAGGSVTLTAPVAASYLWNSGETTQSIVASVDGPYAVTITDGNGCTATSANTNITVLSVPSVQAIAGNNTICAGSTTVLTNATIGGTWSSSNTSVATINSAGVLTAVSNGAASITYSVSNANGCSTAVQFNVNVNANPVLSSNTGSAAVCVGSTSTLANAQAGGTWSSSDVAIATVAANGTITGISAGPAVITYTYTNALGCTSQTSTSVQINALPATTVSTSGSTTFCSGGSVTLTAPAGMTYAWSTGEPTQAITVSTAGSYSVTVTNSNFCSATSAPVSVTVNALPAVSIAHIGATTFCAGGSVSLIAPLNSTYTYSWNNSSNAIAGASNNTYVASATGSYTLTVTDANGCTATSSAIPVTVNALPVVTATANGATTFCDGGSVTLSATGAATYVWSNGATTPSITVSSSDDYSVTGTTVEGCSSVSNAITVVVNALPTASITSTGSSVCLGSTVTLTAAGGATYSWSNGSTNATINVTAANTYTVTVTSAAGCSSTASETVVFNTNPAVVISANGPTVFCTGGSLTLTATGGSNYVWSNGDQGASTTVHQSGNYYVIATNAAGCTTQSSVVNVTVNNNPTVAAITGANAVCEGGSVHLTSATQGGVWSAANNFIATIDGAGYVTGLNAGSTTITYTVTSNGCTASTSAQVSVLNNPVTPTITASGNTTLCPGGSVVLFASNGANYQWSSGATTPFIVADQSGSYTVSVTSINGCTATSLPIQVFIGDNTAPVITAPLNVTVTPNLGCEAIGVALGNPITSDNCGVASVSNDAPSIFPIGPTVVTWTVTDNSGNTSSATQVVTVVDNNAPVVQAPADVKVASNVYCEAIGVDLGNPIATDNCTNNLTITNNAPAVYPLGNTIVTWTVVDGAGNITTVDQTVTVADESAPQVLLANTSVILDANGYATLGFEDLDNGSVDNCGIASAVLSQSAFDCSNTGDNLITVYVTDNSGNQSSASVLVTVVASDACGGSQWSGPVVPDAFTPNGNNYNDTWVIPGLEGYTTKKMEIYSRYGTVVYGADSYNNDWDGTLLNTGTPVPDGTYYYILTLNGGKQLNGYVYINRVQK